MVHADFSGRDLVKALRSNGFRPVTRTGSHVKLRYEHPTADDVRIVTVPLSDADQISQDTYRSIADQCGANDFEAWVTWVERNC